MAGETSDWLLLQRRAATPTFDGPQIGRISKTLGSRVMVVIPSFSEEVEWGPAPYPAGNVPAVGQECCVLFPRDKAMATRVYVVGLLT